MAVPVKMVLTIQSIMTVGLIWKTANTLMRSEPKEIFIGTVIVVSQLPITVMQMPKRDFSFEKVEQRYYTAQYGDFIFFQNERNIKNRHPERNRTVEDLLKNKKTSSGRNYLSDRYDRRIRTAGNSVAGGK